MLEAMRNLSLDEPWGSEISVGLAPKDSTLIYEDVYEETLFTYPTCALNLVEIECKLGSHQYYASCNSSPPATLTLWPTHSWDLHCGVQWRHVYFSCHINLTSLLCIVKPLLSTME